MGFRSKIVFLMIVYFAGFATAIYYLAPGRAKAAYQDTNSASSQSAAEPAQSSIMDSFLKRAAVKASGAFSGMSRENFKEKFNLGLQKLMEMSGNNSKEQDNK